MQAGPTPTEKIIAKLHEIAHTFPEITEKQRELKRLIAVSDEVTTQPETGNHFFIYNPALITLLKLLRIDFDVEVEKRYPDTPFEIIQPRTFVVIPPEKLLVLESWNHTRPLHATFSTKLQAELKAVLLSRESLKPLGILPQSSQFDSTTLTSLPVPPSVIKKMRAEGVPEDYLQSFQQGEHLRLEVDAPHFSRDGDYPTIDEVSDTLQVFDILNYHYNSNRHTFTFIVAHTVATLQQQDLIKALRALGFICRAAIATATDDATSEAGSGGSATTVRATATTYEFTTLADFAQNLPAFCEQVKQGIPASLARLSSLLPYDTIAAMIQSKSIPKRDGYYFSPNPVVDAIMSSMPCSLAISTSNKKHWLGIRPADFEREKASLRLPDVTSPDFIDTVLRKLISAYYYREALESNAITKWLASCKSPDGLFTISFNVAPRPVLKDRDPSPEEKFGHGMHFYITAPASQIERVESALATQGISNLIKYPSHDGAIFVIHCPLFFEIPGSLPTPEETEIIRAAPAYFDQLRNACTSLGFEVPAAASASSAAASRASGVSGSSAPPTSTFLAAALTAGAGAGTPAARPGTPDPTEEGPKT